ncbi:unnamed protein product [Didymodactylos carnosus]|uniref:N-acetyltransferase domain-containing protein n=1 Tax=Didymodactylos carnosus TaxID=1234261 RepID=A0A814EBK5_9BILA|nr:unnamed protein product [Didymodactylos carnosus]CAF0968679.1 unnamed protein product [Didymodactylos carnosus]CAF3521937.1 unnamed protein product [Didymodactylos carnosus]CAF3741926.1 unnamed protein product [Didymodactylos carnosus]
MVEKNLEKSALKNDNNYIDKIKTKSGKTYFIRDFCMEDRFDIQQLCSQERLEINVQVYRACFRNRFTYITLVVLMFLCMCLFNRILWAISLPPLLISSFLIYRISKMKSKLKTPLQHNYSDYIDKPNLRRILVVVENDNKNNCEQIIGFCAFSTFPLDRLAAFITHFYILSKYRRQGIGQKLLSVSREKVIDAKYRRLNIVCSRYQSNGIKYLLKNNFYLKDTWSTCVFVPRITDEQVLLTISPLIEKKGN